MALPNTRGGGGGGRGSHGSSALPGAIAAFLFYNGRPLTPLAGALWLTAAITTTLLQYLSLIHI